MEAFVWGERYLVGNADIDSQHRELVRLINAFAVAKKEAGANRHALLDEMFGELLAYASFHFSFEEALFARSGLEAVDLAEHHRQHGQYVESMRSLYEEGAGRPEEAGEKLLSFLVDWLSRHIQISDRAALRRLASRQPLQPGE